MAFRRAVWEKGKKRITGMWEYRWHSDRFVIILDSVDRITGDQRSFVVAGEKPEWNGWKEVKDGN